MTLIKREDAIALLTEIVFDEPPYFDSETLCRLYAEEQINTLPSAEIAETEPIVIRSRTLMPTKDFKEWAKRVREGNPNVIVIPCDAEVVSTDAEWIPCSERLPQCGFGMHYLVTLKDGHCFKDNVYEAFYDKHGWHIGDNELADDDIVAWMPLPKPWKGADDE